jgi:hypothetical protein
MMLENLNKLGAVVAIAFFISAILVFTFRLLGKPQIGHWIGFFEFLLAIPLFYLILTASQLQRPALFYIQVGCMMAWLLVEALLDYILKVEFRNVGAGGMLGLAANAGRVWTISAVILFFIMAILAFVQRAVTGM